jgi:3-methyl-2-oxobutanoate hydroxymethyltransferase
MSTFKLGDFTNKKNNQQKITVVTAYDYFSAKIVQNANIDVILVGDSLGMVIQGHDSTIPVTIDDMLYHAKLVKRGASNSFIVVDMPYLSYHNNISDTITNAGLIMKQTQASAIKIEVNDIATIKHIEALIQAQIPVMAHIGLTPQSVNIFGGYKVQGKNEEQAAKILNLAKLLENAGVFAIVLECMPNELAKTITNNINVATIGIGSGVNCDGQVLVFHDLLGINNGHQPKFVKQYLNSYELMQAAITEYKNEVELSKFPTIEYSY